MAAWHMRKVPVRFTSRICCQLSSATSWLCSKRRMPALFTSRSSRPCSRAAATAAGAKAGSLTSPTSVVTASGRAASLAVAASPSSARSVATTVAPSSTSRCTVARPMPDAPPVTSATRPSYRCMAPRLERVLVSWLLGWSSFQYRTIVDWLAVASRVPSSAQRCTTPWPKPLAMRSTRMSSSTHSVGTSRPTRSVLSRLLPPGHARRAPGRSRRARSRRGSRAWRPTCRARRGCAPTAPSARPADGGPGSSSKLRASARRTSMRSMIESVVSWREMRSARTSSGAGHVGHLRPLPAGLQRPHAQRGVHREDLAVADVADRPGLGDLLARRRRS